MGPDHPDYEAMREEFFCNYERCMTERTFAFDGVHGLIDALRAQGLAWGVVTNKSQRFTNPLTAAMPLVSSAGTIVRGDTTPHAKPHPAPLLEAARQLGVLPAQCLYVGDDERDIVAGHAAGMLTVAATYGYLGSQSDVAAWNAHAQINSPMALLQLLASA
jgi:phosphoglycolate phosphatase